MKPLISQLQAPIAALCRQTGVRQLELFGSAARGDFDPDTSDLDFFVEFEELGWKGSSDRYFGLLHGLEDLFHCHIDLVERKSVENPYFLQVADQHREVLYAV